MLSSTFDTQSNVVDDSNLLANSPLPAVEPSLQGLASTQNQLSMFDFSSDSGLSVEMVRRTSLSDTLEANLFFVDDQQLAAWETSPSASRDSLTGYSNVAVYGENQYVLTDGAKTWEAAQAEAESVGGNLVTINDAAEDRWLRETFGRDEGFWMGLSDRFSEGNFQWASGEDITYINWAAGEPNDYAGNQDYGRINFAGDKWDDEYSYTTLRGIIEVSGNGAAVPPSEDNSDQNNGAITRNGSQYLLLNDYTSWENAQAAAQQLGGHLVTINDAAEDQWLKQTFGQDEGFWMGLSDRASEGNFQWASGEAVTYTNWAPGEPNDWQGSQDYGRLNYGNNKQWDDDNFASNYRGLVEIKLDDGDNQTPTPPVVTPPTTPVIPETLAENTFTRNDSQYLLLDESLTWEEAQVKAQQLGGNLVTINDAAEDQWLKQTFGQDESFWMGMTDRDQEGTFRWASGEAVTYTNWAPGEPNDWQGTQDYGRTNFGSNQQWDDNHFYSKHRSIVEIKSSPATDNDDSNPPVINEGTNNPDQPTASEVTYNGSEYRLLSRTQTWEEAQAEARQLGGNLVTINDAAEDQWLRETFGKDRGFWMGLSDRASEGNFQWASGEAVTYTNWAPGEPNDYDGNQDYGRINFAGDQWDDEFSYTRLQGIVEIKIGGEVVLPPNPIVDGGDGGEDDNDIPSIYGDAFTRSVPINYSGYNTNAVEISDWSNENGVRALAQAVRGINAQTLRIPGGDTANYWNWDLGGVTQDRIPWTYPYFLPEELPLSLNYEYGTTASLKNMKPLFDQTGAEPIWVVNMLTSDLNKEIRHLLEAKEMGYSVKKIELGNELYFGIPNYARENYEGAEAPQVGGFPSAAAYAEAAKAWAIAIKSTPGLENTTIAAIGVSPYHVPEQRGVDWMPELLKKTGSDNLSTIDVVDAITLHPYYSTESIGITKSDVGNRTRAGEIARDGIKELRSTLTDPALNVVGLQNEELWITEHNIIEDAVVVVGGTWLQALMLDLHTQEFLKDTRTTVSTAHLLTGNAQWQALTDENGLQIDGSQRGNVDRPFKTDASQAYRPTAMGMLLGQSAEIFDNGTATLLASGEAFIAWQVENSTKEISATNADDRTEYLVLPEGETWEVVTYTADPWATVMGENELSTRVQTLSGGSTLTIDGFTKVVAIAK